MPQTQMKMPLAGYLILPEPALEAAEFPGASTSFLRSENPGEGFFTSDEWRSLGDALDFSERELEVTVLLVAGFSRQAVAARLRKTDGSSVSSQTVRVYIDRIFQKARVHDRLGLVLRLARAHREIVAALSVESRPVRVRAANRVLRRRRRKKRRKN